MNTLTKILLVGFTVLLGLSLWYYRDHPLGTKVIVRTQTYLVDVAVTAKDKEKGLGGRDSMPRDRGMLFVFDHKEIFPFWMKGMQFPLDFVWIDGTTVIDITKNVPVSTDGQYPQYHPVSPVDKILELNAGEADRIGLVVGDSVRVTR